MASIATSSSTPRESRAANWGRFALVGLGTVVAAVLANALVYYIGRATVGYDPQFIILADVGTTIFFTAIPAIGATLLYATLVSMHIIAAAVIIGLLTGLARPPAR